MSLTEAPVSAPQDANLRLGADGPLTELASGVDALYLSGYGKLSPSLVERLVATRELAEAVHAPLGFRLGELSFGLAPHGWGRYRYLLCHELGRVGSSTSGHLPPVRIQPRAELLHAVGPAAAVAGFEGLLGEHCAGLSFTVNRLDLFSDWQGWRLDETHRPRFACKAIALRTFEDGGAFRGFEFGTRSTKTVSARIYDKTAEIARSGADWWPALWGEPHVAGIPVHRVEFELGRQGLAQFGIDSPAQALAGAGDAWRYATSDWLTYRRPVAGANRSRRPIAPEWRCVQQASLAGSPVGLERITAGRRAGSIRRLFPGLAGYLATFAAIVGTAGIDDTLDAVGRQLREDEIARRVPFPERICRRREELTAR